MITPGDFAFRIRRQHGDFLQHPCVQNIRGRGTGRIRTHSRTRSPSWLRIDVVCWHSARLELILTHKAVVIGSKRARRITKVIEARKCQSDRSLAQNNQQKSQNRPFKVTSVSYLKTFENHTIDMNSLVRRCAGRYSCAAGVVCRSLSRAAVKPCRLGRSYLSGSRSRSGWWCCALLWGTGNPLI